MEWLSNFIKGFGRATHKTEEQETPSGDKVKGYTEIDGTTYGITEDPSWFEKAGNFVGNTVDSVKGWRSGIFGDKSDIDEELLGLKYEGKDVDFDGANTYISMLSQYDYLNNKPNLTLEEAVRRKQLDNELNKFTSAGADSKYVNNWKYEWLPDSWRNSLANGNWRFFDEDNAEQAINREKLLGILNENPNVYKYYSDNILSPNEIKVAAEKNPVPYMSESEYKKQQEEKDKNGYQHIFEEKLKEVTKRAVKDKNFKITGMDGELITESDVMKLFNESLSRSGISSTLESQAWAYDKLDDSTAPVIRQMYRDNIESLIELQYYQFTHPEMNSREAQMKFIEEYGNDPFSLDFQHHYSEMNDYEKALVNGIDGLAGTVIPLGYAGYGLLGSTADAEAKARMMGRFINATNVDYSGGLLSDVWDFGTAGANGTMLLFQQAESLLSSAVGVLGSLYQSVKDSVDNGEISFGDFVGYYYGFQTSKSFTTTETFQQFKNPQTKGEATSKWITDHVSMVDDIVELIAPAKWFTLPGKFAKVEDVIKVVGKVDDTIDAVKGTSKLTKIKNATTSKLDNILTAESDEGFSIVSDVQKATGEFNESQKLWNRTKKAVQNVFDKVTGKKTRAINKEMRALGKSDDVAEIGNKGTLFMENLGAWVGEEVITSLAYQSMVPYDYTYNDLAFDIMGAAWSGWLRSRQFWNQLGMVKFGAVSQDKIRGLWYIREVSKASKKDAQKILEHLTDQDLSDIGTVVKTQMGSLLDGFKEMTQEEFGAKIGQMGKGARQEADRQVKYLVKSSEDDLIRKLRSSTQTKWNSMVKKVGNKWTFNKPGENATKAQKRNWAKKFEEAKKKAYSVGGLDGTSYIKAIDNMKKYVKGHIEELLGESGKYKRYVENVNGVWKFKSWVPESEKKKLTEKIIKERLRWAGINLRSVRGRFQEEYKKLAEKDKIFANLYKRGIWNELDNPIPSFGIHLGQRLAYYINNSIINKISDKASLVAGLDNRGAAVSIAFKRWLDEFYDIKDYNVLTYKELANKIIEFGVKYDYAIERQFMTDAKIFNENGILKNNKDLLINQTFQEAIKTNEDLKYMGLFMFSRLVEDKNIPEVRREIKLRTYKWDPKVSGRFENEFYGIVKEGRHVDGFVGTKVFNDNFEEKLLMGREGKIYLKLSKDGQATAIGKVAGTKGVEGDHNIFDHRTDPNGEGVIELIYEKKSANFRKKTADGDSPTGLQIYELRVPTADGRSLRVGYINTYTDPVGGIGPKEIWGQPRFMNIVLDADEYKAIDYDTANFSLYRNTSVDTNPVITINDVSKNVKDDDIVITDSSFDPSQKDYSQQTRSLRVWQDLVSFVYKDADSSIDSWEKFTKLLPGRTDRVPYGYYAKVMSLPQALAVGASDPAKITEFKRAQFNLLLDMMYNKAITHTEFGIKIDMSGPRQFRTGAYSLKYKYKSKEGKKFRTVTNSARIPSDGELIIGKQGVVVIQKDINGVPEVYRYMRRSGSMDVFDLYKADDVTFSKPVGNFSTGGQKLHGNIYTSGKGKTRIMGSMEFQNGIVKKGTEADLDFNKMVDRATGTVEDTVRYGDVDMTIRVEGDGYDMYNKIHKLVYGEDMPMSEYLSMKNIKGMSPERYFNALVRDFKESRFGKYFKINKSKSWEDVADQLYFYNKVIYDLEKFDAKFPNHGISDDKLVDIGYEYMDRLVKGGMKFHLTDAEVEIRKMMFPHKGHNLSFDDFTRLAAYREFGIVPKSVPSKQYQLLINRRDRILAYRLKTTDLDWMDEELKSFLVDRYYYHGGGGFFKTEQELLDDIKENPKEYKAILDAFADKYRELFNSKNKIEKVNKLLDKMDKKIKKLENKIPKVKPKKVMGRRSRALKQYKREVLQGVLKSKIDLKYQQLNELLEKFRLQTPDNPFTAADLKAVERLRSEIAELENGYRLYDRVKQYRNQVWQPNAITKEQWDDIVRRSLTSDEPGYKPHEMSQSEVNARIAQIRNKLPGDFRILTYDPATETIGTELLTDLEKQKVSGQLETIAENIKNGRATAAHVREIHAIVINPKMLQEMDIGHEWFHEAIGLVGFDGFNGRVRRAYTQAWDKFRKEIEQNAENLGYRKMFDSGDLKMTESQYRDWIIEEWLAERFGEFVNGKYFIENEHYGSFIYQFFVELRDRIRMMFSDTEIVDLFEDIYAGINKNDVLKVNFNSAVIDGGDISYRSISKAGRDNVVRALANPTENLPFEYGDILGIDSAATNDLVEQQLRAINDYFLDKGGAKDALVLLGLDFTGRGNLLGMAKATVKLADGREVRASYMDIFEKLTNTAKNIELDDTLQKLYGGPQEELETWVDNALVRLQGGSNAEEYSWLLFNDVYPANAPRRFDEYPITARLSRNADGGIDFSLDVNGNQIYQFGADENHIRGLVSERLAQDEGGRRNLTRLLDTYLAQRSKLVLGKTTLQDFASKWPRLDIGGELVTVEEAINAMGDILWQSILDNYKILYHESFDEFSPIYKILADNVYQVYLYDRLIPHVGRNTGVKRNIFDGLFKKKNDETRRLIEFMQSYGKSNPRVGRLMDRKIGHDADGFPVVQFEFDTKGYKRRIGWHLKSDQEALDLLNSMRADGSLSAEEYAALYDEESGKFKNNLLQARSWNVSLLSLSNSDMTKYVQEPYIGKNFKQNFREWYNNTSPDPLQVKFRSGKVKDVPFIDGSGNPGHKVFDFEKVDLDDVNYRTRTWISDDDLIEPEGFKQITFTSATKHMEDVTEIMKLNKKYHINLRQASQEARDKLNKLKYSKTEAMREMKKSTEFRKSTAELRRLKEQRDVMAKWNNRAQKRLDNFQNTPIYKQIDEIGKVLEKNKETLNAVKKADVSPDVVSEKVPTQKKITKSEKDTAKTIEDVNTKMEKQFEDIKKNPSKYSQGRDVDMVSEERPRETDLANAKEQRLFGDEPEITEDDIVATASSLTTSTQTCG